MGASSLNYRLPVSKYPTEESVRKWYKEAVDYAFSESGDDPYNGTISTTRGIRFSSETFPEDARGSDVWEFIENKTDKWGPVMAIKVKDMWYVGGWAAE